MSLLNFSNFMTILNFKTNSHRTERRQKTLCRVLSDLSESVGAFASVNWNVELELVCLRIGIL